jgi:tryptophan-rich sensory protein
MTHPAQRYRFGRELVLALISVFAVGTASVLGQLATYPNLIPWYANLAKPSFTPPSWVFGPAWTALYVLMAFALWRVLRAPGQLAGRRIAIVLFGLQLFLNAAWSWMFFGANSPLLGMINIVPQLLMILATIAAFARVDKIAAWCLVPLAVWVAYASILNVAIWQLNG